MSKEKKISSPCFTVCFTVFYCVFYYVLLCVLLCFAEVIPWDTKYMRKNSLPVKYWKERAMGRLLQTLKCCCFDRRTKIILREFSQRRVRNLSIRLCSFIASLIKMLTFHCTLYFVQKEQVTQKSDIKYLFTLLGLDPIYTYVVYVIFNVLFSSCISAMFFILAFHKKWVSV